MSAETANLLRTELETSDRLRRNWIETQALLHAAAARLEQQGKELDEARAELREAVSEGIDDRLLAASYQEECANLRAAVEKCNGELGCTAYALLAPSAAPAASEPNRSHATTATKDLSAEAGAGPNTLLYRILSQYEALAASGWITNPAWKEEMSLAREDIKRMLRPVVQQSDAHACKDCGEPWPEWFPGTVAEHSCAAPSPAQPEGK